MLATTSPKRLLRFWNERVTRIPQKNAISTGLLILSSAALGGIAVALWNRKTLAVFHNLEGQEPERSEPKSQEIDEPF